MPELTDFGSAFFWFKQSFRGGGSRHGFLGKKPPVRAPSSAFPQQMRKDLLLLPFSSLDYRNFRKTGCTATKLASPQSTRGGQLMFIFLSGGI